MRDELDLRLVDVAAFHASQSPVLKAGTRRYNALNCRTGLASRTARTLGGERRRVRIGHGIDPGKVKFKRNSGAMVLGGEPLGEKRHIYWNFVSSNQERIAQAARDWRDRRGPLQQRICST
jgi:redox-sensitive bicupin YhaK (pirin superfamily)